MGALSLSLRSVAGGRVGFHCPGCGYTHSIPVRIASAPTPRPDPSDPDWTPPAEYYQARDGAWTWNGSAAKPTFLPSILVRGGHYAPGHTPGSCWCTYNAEHPNDPAPFKCYVCHSFVTDGRIQFLGDCTHALAGQTVEIPPWRESAT